MQQESIPDPLIDVSMESAKALISKVRYEAPMEQAYAGLGRLIVLRYDTIKEIADWYLHPYPTDKDLVSKILNQSDTCILKSMDYFRDIVLAYRQGRAPHGFINELELLGITLVDLLRSLIGDIESLEHVKRSITHLHHILLTTETEGFSRSAYVNAVRKATETIVREFAKVSDDFRQYENILSGKTSKPATQADIKRLHKTVKQTAETVTKSVESIVSESAEQVSVAADQVSAAAEDVADAVTDIAKVAETVEKTAETTDRIDLKTNVIISKQEGIRLSVNRIDSRDKRAKRGKRRKYTIEVQESAWHYWQLGLANETIKRESGRHRPTYQQVFEYYMSELQALGIKDADDFKKCLGARSDRISRNRSNKV